MNAGENKLCPSSSCKEGSLLLGVVQTDKTVTLLNTRLPVDKVFAEKMGDDGSAEKRFRFANKCVKSGCKQWTGSSCGVINILAEANKRIDEDKDDTPLRPCYIRDSCRWFSQEGRKACMICTFVVTNNMDETPP